MIGQIASVREKERVRKTQYEIGYYRFELSDFSLVYLQVMGT